MAKQVCAWLVVLLLITMSGLESCSLKDEETAIRELVKKGATLGEEQDFNILYPRPSVELKPDKRSASSVFPFLIVKKETTLPKLKELYEDPQRWLETVGENADLYRLKLECVKQNGD